MLAEICVTWLATLISTQFMDKKLSLKLNGGRLVSGILRGFDPFMNLVVDDTVEETKDGSKNYIGMVVIRGNSIVMLEALDRV
ncbi:putative small nuclear ribonucleoprotein G [Blattella germanica]|nr:putative small nuclear ribonucleoprotein G [Blattella germanica]